MVKFYDIQKLCVYIVMKYDIFYLYILKNLIVCYIYGIYIVIYFVDVLQFFFILKQVNNEDKKNIYCGEKYNEYGDKCVVDRGRGRVVVIG